MALKYLFLVLVISIFLATVTSHPTENDLNSHKELDPEEIGGYFEGDMILDEEEIHGILNTRGRSIRVGEKYKWKKGIVHYEIDPIFDKAQVNHILKAMRTIEKVSCIRFYPKDEKTSDYIRIKGLQNGCNSRVGHQGGEQIINLQPQVPGKGCFVLHKIVHEFFHSLGFYHQQSAFNRDDYIVVVEENIREGYEKAFKKHDIAIANDLGVPYDYESVMHYGPSLFSKNGQPTIIPLDPTANIGQREKLTEKDIMKLNLLYNCDRH